MSQDLFMSDDEDVASFGNQIRSLKLSPLKQSLSNRLDNMLINELICDKNKPRQDILLTLQSQQPLDPYAEFALDQNTPPIRKIRSPDKGFAFFGGKSIKTPTPRSSARRVPYSTSRRSRLPHYAPAFSPTPPDASEVYTAKPTRRPRTAVNTPQSVDMVTPQRDDETFLSIQTDGYTPRRGNLRPRKRAWIDQELIPLAALCESYRYHQIEREEKKAEEEKKSSSKKTGHTDHGKVLTKGGQTTLPRTRRNRHVAKTPFTPTYSGRLVSSKRRLRFDGDDSDEESMMALLKRVKINKDFKKRTMASDSEDELLVSLAKRLQKTPEVSFN